MQIAADVARDHKIDELLPFATPALREATNGKELLERVERETGVKLQVLSGEDEARLTFLAVRRWYGWSAENILLFDIGGGSLEIAAGPNENPDVALSLPLGAGRSTVGFLHNDPPLPHQVKALREHAAAVISDAMGAFDGRPALPGITADRTFQIVAGGIVLSEAMAAFRVDELEVSPWALREGIILRYLDRLG